MTKLQPLFTWRNAVCESQLPATARHVAITLSLYMSERGDSAFPGAIRLARDTNLTERCVRQQLALLVRQGWLALVEKGGAKGEKRKANVYAARVPADELPLDGGTSFTREPASPVNVSAATPEPEDTRPLNHVQTISSVELPKNSLSQVHWDIIDSAVTVLVERDVQAVKDKRDVRAVRRVCRQERKEDGTRDRLAVLAAKHPDWSAEALANAVGLDETMHAPSKVELPDCYLCDNTRWTNPDEGPVVRCPRCWPQIEAQREAV